MTSHIESAISTRLMPSPLATKGHHRRIRLEIRGRVQGVGFRPYVYRLATELTLTGRVGNDTQGAYIELQGRQELLDRFRSRLVKDAPKLAAIREVVPRTLTPIVESAFRIDPSDEEGRRVAEISPDSTLCPDCLREMFDRSDRRYHYPFINCTNCGPRYSIVQSVPYDRPNTTMAAFTMCPQCQAEYDDPSDRRFHAQPNACPVCGPRIWYTDAAGREIDGDAICLAAEALKMGRIIAMKGIGGFHLACHADDDDAVRLLRSRKGRETKPFAVMAPCLDTARTLAEIDDASAAALLDVSRPIVLLPRKRSAQLSDRVAPHTDSIGIMLPYTPLHELLFAQGLGPLVMTSGNPSAEPLCCDNAEALRRLGASDREETGYDLVSIADGFLLHDREIERRVDDSVMLALDTPQPRIVPIRRARGFVPEPVHVRVNSPEPILAVGAGLKSTVCILDGDRAVLSEHLGDLFNPAAYRNFTATVAQLEELLDAKPAVVAYDLHPEYMATHYALERAGRVLGVQHHHAHVVSAMADNDLEGEVIGVACDGTGYGTDGAIWGCEILVADELAFRRAAHLDYFPLLGGDAAARETWRPAAGLLRETFGERWLDTVTPWLTRFSDEQNTLALQRLKAPHRLPQTSSLGRLFDAVAYFAGLCDVNHNEAQAAMALETAARQEPPGEILPFLLKDAEDSETPMRLDVRPMIRAILGELAEGNGPSRIARMFHDTLVAMLAESVGHVAKRSGLDRVVLSGGCFVNRILAEGLYERLNAMGLKVFMHRRVPTTDGGIALGQAVSAAARLRRLASCA